MKIMDLGSFQKEISQVFLAVVTILTSTFQQTSEPKIISPLQTQVETKIVPNVEEMHNSSSAASIKISTTSAELTTTLQYQSTEVLALSYNNPTNSVKQNQYITPTIKLIQNIVLPTLTPTPTLTVTPTPTPTPTVIPSVTKPKEIVLVIPSPAVISTQKSLNADTILQLINDHRKELGYAPFEKDTKLCELATYRGPQLEEEIFTTGAIHQGLYDLNLPYQIIENMASYSSEQQIFNWWMNSKLHRTAIEGNYKYSCGVCNGNSCAQLFTNYTPKYYY